MNSILLSKFRHKALAEEICLSSDRCELLYTSLGNNPFVGHAYSLTPYINFPLYQTPHFRFCYRFGTGLSWLTKKFNVNTDYNNIAIATNINASIRTDFEAHWYIQQAYAFRRHRIKPLF